jgi:two-component system NtrC family sensor kinase
MKDILSRVFKGRLQVVLIGSFSLVAALTVSLGTLVTSRVINNYLASAEEGRVARDMDLAQAFYQLKLDEVAAISHRLVLDPWVVDNLQAAGQGQSNAIQVIDQEITNKITVLALGGTHLITVLNEKGDVITGQVLLPDGTLKAITSAENMMALPIVSQAFTSQKDLASTEVIPAEFLQPIGLAQQASIQLLQTPRAAPVPFDTQEGTAGFTLTGISLLHDPTGKTIGAVVTAYLFNNDFTLVDRIKQVAGVDTVTIFFGDLRVSTNVMTESGERAVGTLVSQAVRDVVLANGQDYVGRAFVVNQMYITRYIPLYDHSGRIVGMLYVGALVSAFETLVHTFNERVALIALVCILLAGVIAVPITRLITQPITELVEANRRLAQGDMTVRVQPSGSSELGLLGTSFNHMAETLQHAQQELLQKERLASMGQLAAGVAHEINNPLGTILLYSDVLYKELPEEDPRRSDLKMIIDETNRCKTIVADLLNFARQHEVMAKIMNLHDLLDEALKGLVKQPKFEGIRVEKKYDPDLPFIMADSDQLRQVFIILLENAADAIKASGTITLSTRPVDEHWIEIRISDTGCGIAKENLSKVFTPFFTTKPLGQGTGLGLSIAYGIIKMHRGQISLQSKVGEGTTVTITLPLRQPLNDPTIDKSSAYIRELIG